MKSVNAKTKPEALAALTAQEVIGTLNLRPHPEGGYYRETFRDQPDDHDRARSTSIYYLLTANVVSRWHRIDAVEVWHWHAGAPLELWSTPPDGATASLLATLGINLRAGEQPQAVVPAHHWQQARSLGEWTLLGVTVAPGFTFDTLEFAQEDFAPMRSA